MFQYYRKKKEKPKRFGVVPIAFKKYDNLDAKGIMAVIVAQGSVIDFTGDAIVNAANEGCLSGGGVDGAITKAGGRDLAEARYLLPEIRRGVRCLTGDAKFTIGGDLKADYCIHAVGPAYWKVGMNNVTDEDMDTLLYSAYQKSMQLAQENKITSLAFSLLSAGVFRSHRSLEAVLQIGLKAIVENLYEGLKEVYMVGYTSKECLKLKEIMEKLKNNETIEIPIELNASRVQLIQDKLIEHKKKRETKEENEKNETTMEVEETNEEVIKKEEEGEEKIKNIANEGGLEETVASAPEPEEEPKKSENEEKKTTTMEVEEKERAAVKPVAVEKEENENAMAMEVEKIEEKGGGENEIGESTPMETEEIIKEEN